MYLLDSKNRCEYEGNIKDIISYIFDTYEMDYYMYKYKDQLQYDKNKLKFILQGLNLKIVSQIPSKNKRQNKRK